MKKINKESLQKFEEKIKQYEYYQFQGVSRFLTRKKEVNLEIAFFNNEGYRELQYFEFTIKFFDNKFRPKYFPEYEIFHTYNSKEMLENKDDDNLEKAVDSFIENINKAETISDGVSGFKMTKIPNSMDWELEFEGGAEDLKNEAINMIQAKYSDSGYKLAIEMAKVNLYDEFRPEAIGSMHRAAKLLDIINDVFDNEQMEEFYYEKLNDERMREAVYKLVRNINTRVGDNDLDDYDYSLFFNRGVFETNVGINITNIHTGEEL